MEYRKVKINPYGRRCYKYRDIYKCFMVLKEMFNTHA